MEAQVCLAGGAEDGTEGTTVGTEGEGCCTDGNEVEDETEELEGWWTDDEEDFDSFRISSFLEIDLRRLGLDFWTTTGLITGFSEIST